MASTSASSSGPQYSLLNSPDRHRLSGAEQLLSTLAAEITKVRTLKASWMQNIASKLNGLSSSLRYLSKRPSSEVVTELLRLIFETLSDALLLADQCINPYPGDGELETPSDIDVVVAKLDQFMEDVNLLESRGWDLSKVGLEAIKLITKLKLGSDLLWKMSALDSLMELLSDDDWNVMVAMNLDLLPVLLPLLDSSSLELKQKSLSIICSVLIPNSYLEEYGDYLIERLHSFLESRDGSFDDACNGLEGLSLSPNMANAMGSKHGLIPSLLNICESGTPSSKANAVSTLKNIISISYETSKQIFIDEGAMAIFIRLASTGPSDLARDHAIECINGLVSVDDNMKREFVAKGGIDCLKYYWHKSPMTPSLIVAPKLVKNLATVHKIGDLIVSKAWVIRKLLEMLEDSEDARLRIAALRAIYELSLASKKAREKIGIAKFRTYGAITLMTRSLIKAIEVEVKEMAARAISSLMQNSGNIGILAKEKEKIEGEIQLLDRQSRDVIKKYLVSVLASAASNSKKCRKKAIKVATAFNLQNLLDLEINGARRICDAMHRSSSARPSFSLCRGNIDVIN